MPPIFYIKDGNLSFAEHRVLIDLELYISAGDRIALVGRNGSGKSSLMKIISGIYELDKGDLYADPSCHISYLKQDINNIQNIKIIDFLRNSYAQDGENHDFLINMMLENFQIPGNANLLECSGGQIRRALLAAALLQEPDILLLDEPTNHLDITIIQWLEEYVQSYKGAIVTISHDRAFLENTTNKVWWIDRGELRISNRGFKYYDEWRDEIIALEEAQLRKMSRKLEAEKGWLNTGVTARRKRNQRRLAHLHRLREDLKNHQEKLGSAKNKLKLELLEEEKKAKFIIETENLSYSIGGKNLISNFDFKVKKGEKIGIIGSNGSGKSSFVKLLVGELKPLEGKVNHGVNLEITYFDQYRTALDPKSTIVKTLCPTGGDHVFLKDREMHVAAYIKNFMFDPKMLNHSVMMLSGGEANRLLLAKCLIKPGNLLILDEPTNDLDMDSLEILLEMLAEYDGTLIVISHDRDFLERLVTRTIIFENGNVHDMYGGYSDYVRMKKQEELVSRPLDTKNQGEGGKKKSTSGLQKNAPKLSYKYQRLWEVLPKEIEKLEEEITEIEKYLHIHHNLYISNNEKFISLTKDLEKKRKSIEDKTEEWLEIEGMIEN